MKKATQRSLLVNIHRARYRIYDAEGPEQPDITWLPLSYGADGNGCYVMRMSPGSETIIHTHERMEEFLVLEGEVIESDGTRLHSGDFISYPPGSRHNTRTETGCLLIGFDWRREPGPKDE